MPILVWALLLFYAHADLSPVDSVKSFYDGFDVPATSSTVDGSTAQTTTTTSAPKPQPGINDRNTAIVSGVAAGAGLSAVAGGVVIAVKEIVADKQKAKHKQRVATMTITMTTTTSTLTTTTTSSTTTTTTTTTTNEEIPMVLWIVIGVIVACCLLAACAATIEWCCNGGKKRKRTTASEQSTWDTETEASSYSKDISERTAGTLKSVDDAGSARELVYEQVPKVLPELPEVIVPPLVPPALSFVHVPEMAFQYAPIAQASPTPFEPETAFQYAPIAQASPTPFDPYSYARETGDLDDHTVMVDHTHGYVQAAHVAPPTVSPYANAGAQAAHVAPPTVSPYANAGALSYGVYRGKHTSNTYNVGRDPSFSDVYAGYV